MFKLKTTRGVIVANHVNLKQATKIEYVGGHPWVRRVAWVYEIQEENSNYYKVKYRNPKTGSYGSFRVMDKQVERGYYLLNAAPKSPIQKIKINV